MKNIKLKEAWGGGMVEVVVIVVIAGNMKTKELIMNG